jgi:hypothetical protein|tara:strand:+ start:1609 stop:2016 length:408 start_codon:yes stop_codon:yes gene_type:complete
MKEPVINLITPPDKLFNDNKSFLLVNPSEVIKEQFNELAKQIGKDLNVYLFDQNDSPNSIWLLDVVNQVDNIILDVDATRNEFAWLVGYLLNFDKTYYLTNQEEMPYNIINNHRIYDVRTIVEEKNNLKIQQGQA